MFWKITLMFSLMVLASCQFVGNEKASGFVERQFIPDGNTTFFYAYNISNGISVNQTGYTKEIDLKSMTPVYGSKGCYSYTSPEGAFISVTYIAEEKGYQPVPRVTYPGQPNHENHLKNPCAKIEQYKSTVEIGSKSISSATSESNFSGKTTGQEIYLKNTDSTSSPISAEATTSPSGIDVAESVATTVSTIPTSDSNSSETDSISDVTESSPIDVLKNISDSTSTEMIRNTSANSTADPISNFSGKSTTDAIGIVLDNSTINSISSHVSESSTTESINNISQSSTTDAINNESDSSTTNAIINDPESSYTDFDISSTDATNIESTSSTPPTSINHIDARSRTVPTESTENVRKSIKSTLEAAKCLENTNPTTGQSTTESPIPTKNGLETTTTTTTVTYSSGSSTTMTTTTTTATTSNGLGSTTTTTTTTTQGPDGAKDTTPVASGACERAETNPTPTITVDLDDPETTTPITIDESDSSETKTPSYANSWNVLAAPTNSFEERGLANAAVDTEDLKTTNADTCGKAVQLPKKLEFQIIDGTWISVGNVSTVDGFLPYVTVNSHDPQNSYSAQIKC